MSLALIAPIDIYCERLGPGLLAEPINLLTNGLFVLAGVVALMTRPREVRGAWWMLVLSWLVISIGIGSALFHSFANGWSMLADVVPIGIYMYVFIGFCAAVLLGHHWPGVVLALLGLLVLLALGSRLPSEPFNGSNSYFGAAAALLGLALLCRRAGHPAWRDLAIAFGLFCVSLTLRSIDMAVCERWPLGTHFLWHSFNALLLYFTLRAAAIGLRWRALDPSSIVSNAQANPGDTSNGGSTRR